MSIKLEEKKKCNIGVDYYDIPTGKLVYIPISFCTYLFSLKFSKFMMIEMYKL